jgi:hypothetical protein
VGRKTMANKMMGGTEIKAVFSPRFLATPKAKREHAIVNRHDCSKIVSGKLKLDILCKQER